MKKAILIICLICFIFLSACADNKHKQITVAEAGYSCDATVEYGEKFSSNVTVNVNGGGVFAIKINSPENIKGLGFSFNNNEMKVNYNDLVLENNFPLEYGGFAKILNEIFLKFTLSNMDIPNKDGVYVYEENTSEYSFKVFFNEQGFPLIIVADEEKLKATFSNWKY